MKKYSVYIIIVAACFFLESCVSSQNDAPEQGAAWSAVKFTPVIVEGIIPFDPETPGSAQFEIRLALSEPADTGSGSGKLIRKLLYEGQSASNYGEAVVVEHEKIYTGQRTQWIPQGGAQMPSFNWYYVETVESRTVSAKDFIPGCENLLVVTKTTESYLGGAHGNHFTSCFVIDPAAARRLTLDDIFNSPEKLRLALEEELRRQYQQPKGAPLSLAGFFEDSIELPENFFFAEDASGDSPFIHFLWNAYEIAPYVMGAIEVSLPLKSLSPLLRK
jgi:hypothetical protein